MSMKLLFASAALMLSLAGADHAWGSSSFSQSRIQDNSTSTPPESNGTTSSAVSEGANSASSFLLTAAGKLGASVASDGSVFGVSTSTVHVDDWICDLDAACLAVGPLNATIDFDATFSGPGTMSEFSLVAQYFVGGSVFNITVGEDGGPVTAAASWGVVPVDVVLTTDTQANTIHVSTHFTGGTEPMSCNGAAGPCVIFTDRQLISLEMEGKGFVDASHTFAVSLAPVNPAIFLTSADGRSAGTSVSAVPEPGTFALLAVGLAGFAARGRAKGVPDRPRRARSSLR